MGARPALIYSGAVIFRTRRRPAHSTSHLEARSEASAGAFRGGQAE